MKRTLLIAGLSAGAIWAQPRVQIGVGSGSKRPPAIAQWEKLGPAQKKERLDRLPPERRIKVEQQYESYQKLSPEERGRLDQSYESFRQLPPERQEETRQVYKRFASLDKSRRDAVRKEYTARLDMTEEQLAKRLRSDEVKKQFSSEERDLLDDLSRVSHLPED